MASSDTSKRDLNKLESELRDLRKFKDEVESGNQTKSKIPVFAMKVWMGPNLSRSIEEWMRVKRSSDPEKAISATANLLAALFRRIMRVSLFLVLMAIIPMFLIVWQNIIMERQNQSLISQIEAERTASSNQQVTEYLRLLLSNDKRQVAAAEGFLVSDLVNRDISVERLAALIKPGNSDVQCSALKALTRIIQYSSDLTLKDVIAPDTDKRAIVSDLQCENIDFIGVNFGPITFIDVGFPHSTFASSNLSDVEFQDSNLRHSDFSKTYLCKDTNRCISFQDVDLSYANFTLTNRNKNVFHDDVILQGAQLKFDPQGLESAVDIRTPDGVQQTKRSTLIVPKIPKENIIASGVCYETSYSQCYLFHKENDLGRLDEQKLNSLRQYNCPLNLNGPIILTSISSCENLGLKLR